MRVGNEANWWSYGEYSTFLSNFGVGYNFEGIFYSETDKKEGLSIRCLKD